MTLAAGGSGAPTGSQRQLQLGLLAGGMGHDMRNAVMPMLLHLDLLEMATATLEPPSGIDVRHLVENLQRLANGLLLRCTESESTPAAAPMDLHTWWDEVGDLLRSTLPRSCTLDVRIDPGLPRVVAQPAVLAQVMLHLMVNVHLALDGGTPCVVSLTATRSRRGVALSVQDEAARSAPPVRRSAQRMASQWGTTLARTLLQRAGGDITGHSIRGQGTEVTIHLPVAPDDAGETVVAPRRRSAARPRATPAQRARPTTRGHAAGDTTVSVLCIDDNAALTSALALRLGMDARFALLPPMHALDDSVARIEALAAAVVLLDLNLPGTERPLDVIRALRARNSDSRVLVLTGNPSPEAVTGAREAGAHGFIAKGVAPERLISAILRAGAGEFVLELDD
ncbi:MAG: response regulator [Gemmatimonadota bacterium]